MTVKELIIKLLEYPLDYEVCSPTKDLVIKPHKWAGASRPTQYTINPTITGTRTITVGL